MVASKKLLAQGMNVGDARKLAQFEMPAPSCIITSPPYLDMFDYGVKTQIGFGQTETKYIEDMSAVLESLHEISTPTAVLWLVVGALRRKGRLLDLPGRFVAIAERSGWELREDITWNKGKSMPWTKHGEFRDVTERVLLLTKTADYRFDTKDLRSPEPNSVWWQRYPERYSPAGARPTNVWDIPIPTQGSWGRDRQHFCPFPPELVHRMLSLTTAQGDVVLDPFAGTGIVVAMANAMSRVGYGVDLSRAYVNRYSDAQSIAHDYLRGLDVAESRREQFKTAIVQLRTLKFARVIGHQLVEHGIPTSWVEAKLSTREPVRPFAEFSADFVIGTKAPAARVLERIEHALSRPPLSKFGLDPQFEICRGAPAKDLHWWSDGRFWNKPSSARPRDGGLHVAAGFRPNTLAVDPTPYA